MEFSIIVPVYRVEEYLHECIESVLNQTYEDYELILVDDGSPDFCPQICDIYAYEDSRIRVIHQKNRGVSSARNIGLSESTGKYIVFLDGDDVLCADVLLKIDAIIHENANPDIIIGNIVHWDGKDDKIIVDNGKYMRQQEDKSIFGINELFARNHVQLPWRVYQSVYNRKFLEQNRLCFDETLVCAEDLDFYLRVLEKVSSYRLTDAALVKYRFHREGSIINSPDYKSVTDQLTVFYHAFENAKIFHDVTLMQQYFADRYTNIIILAEYLINNKEKKQCYEFIADHRSVLKHTSINAKYLMARAMWFLLGFQSGNKLLLKGKRYRHGTK